MSTPYRNPDPHAPPPVVVTTSTDVPGHMIVEVLGVVRGIALRLKEGSTSLEQALSLRKAAEQQMMNEARSIGARAVICMRYDSNESEVVAYGTAVRLS